MLEIADRFCKHEKIGQKWRQPTYLKLLHDPSNIFLFLVNVIMIS